MAQLYVYKPKKTPTGTTGRRDWVEYEFANFQIEDAKDLLLQKFPNLEIIKSISLYEPAYGYKFDTNDGFYYAIWQTFESESDRENTYFDFELDLNWINREQIQAERHAKYLRENPETVDDVETSKQKEIVWRQTGPRGIAPPLREIGTPIKHSNFKEKKE